jgi:hypothetical protein
MRCPGKSRPRRYRIKDVFPTLYCPTKRTCGLAAEKDSASWDKCNTREKINSDVAQLESHKEKPTIKLYIGQERTIVKVVILITLFHWKNGLFINSLQLGRDNCRSISCFVTWRRRRRARRSSNGLLLPSRATSATGWSPTLTLWHIYNNNKAGIKAWGLQRLSIIRQWDALVTTTR